MKLAFYDGKVSIACFDFSDPSDGEWLLTGVLIDDEIYWKYNDKISNKGTLEENVIFSILEILVGFYDFIPTHRNITNDNPIEMDKDEVIKVLWKKMMA